MKPKQITAFESEDGTIFKSESEAMAHDALKEWNKFHSQINAELLQRVGEADIKQIIAAWRGFNEKKQTDNIEYQPISILKLPIRYEKMLFDENILSIGDLIGHRENDILKIPNLGRKTLDEIKESLLKQGLSLHPG